MLPPVKKMISVKKSIQSIAAFVTALAFTFLSGSSMNAEVKVTLEPDALLTQHWAMPTLLNPAATGDIDFIRIRGGARLDYLGSKDSPKNFLATGDSPFKVFGKRIGAGVVVNSNSYDLFRNLQVSAQGSYKLRFKNCSLSIGLQAGYFHTKFKGSEFVIYHTPGQDGEGTGPDIEGGEEGETENPPAIEDDGNDINDYPTQDVSAGTFDLGVGIRFEHPKFYVGVSGMHLTNPKMELKKDGQENTDSRYMESKLPMTLYFEAGGNIGLNNTLFTLQPSLLLGTEFSKIDAVLDLRATYNNRVTFGLDYRWNRAAGIMAGLIIKDFYVGYAWEYDYSLHPHGSTGNHELVLGYQFKLNLGGKNTFSHRSIRIM